MVGRKARDPNGHARVETVAASGRLAPPPSPKGQYAHGKADPRLRKDGTPAKPTSRTWTRAEVESQERWIEDALVRGYSDGQIARMAKRSVTDGGIDCGAVRTKALIDRIASRLERESDERAKHARAAQVRRIVKYIQDADAKPIVENGQRIGMTKANHQALGRYEALLSSLLGTAVTPKLTVDMAQSEALKLVVAAMTPEELAAYAAKELERETKP